MGDTGIYVKFTNNAGETIHGKVLNKDQTTELAKKNLVALLVMNEDYSKHLFTSQGKLLRMLVKASKLQLTGYIN
jgi:hypothetical protein